MNTLHEQIKQKLEELWDSLRSGYESDSGSPGPTYFFERAHKSINEILELVKGK